MSKIVVCGLVNMETTAPVESFPIEYRPIDYKFLSLKSAPAGVGLNVSLALNTLGDDVTLCSLCGDDFAAKIIKSHLEDSGISAEYVLSTNKATAQSVVLYDNSGRRYIICDLADNQENTYKKEVFKKALKGADIACLCNINFAAELLSTAKEEGVLVATDVHCLSDVCDEYNSRFMRAADILFLSNENIKGREKDFVKELISVYSPKIVVVGMGSEGALLYTAETGSFTEVPAVYTRPVVNTVGAGDSLYSSFIHFYAKTRDALYSLKKAVYFASYKIGAKSASEGFLSEGELLKIAKD
ncbi:MAG: carbohydrate kinase family protein [Ruminococcaceae bacterium]|nr:carbohydrate kinase family protein [Oscillospiraceae bacterium]